MLFLRSAHTPFIHSVFFCSPEQTTLENEVANKNSCTWEGRIIYLGPYYQQMLQYSLLILSTVFFLFCHMNIAIFHLAIQAFIHLVFFFFLTYNVYFLRKHVLGKPFYISLHRALPNALKLEITFFKLSPYFTKLTPLVMADTSCGICVKTFRHIQTKSLCWNIFMMTEGRRQYIIRAHRNWI